jgi:hypothetical protein
MPADGAPASSSVPLSTTPLSPADLNQLVPKHSVVQREMSAERVPHHWSYRLSSRRIRSLRLLTFLPPAIRASLAERHLRRPGQPGPAAEHVYQYLVSDTLAGRRAAHSEGSVGADPQNRGPRKPIVVGQADFFYRTQYRSRFSPVMGAFAATATQVLAASGSAPTGRLWWRSRQCHAAMLPSHAETGIRPIIVLNDGAVAVAVFVPRTDRAASDLATNHWMFDNASMPEHLGALMRGDVSTNQQGIGRTRLRDHAGSVAALIDAARTTGNLALLALHPRDPDAMGLHITLFGVEVLTPELLVHDYGLVDANLDAHRAQAATENAILGYLVGGTAEVFTQCSQNLFVKELIAESHESLDDPPDIPVSLEELLATQFETLQVTVDASALPGASPRNGPVGGAAFVETRRGRKHVLIPYYPGNAIHGHAGKLWTNPRAALVVTDDHTLRRRATIAGRSWVASHEWISKRFPELARSVTHPDGGDEQTVGTPVYWFVTRVDEVTWERSNLPKYKLTDGRGVCTINAGGEGRHTKQPKYFDAGGVEPYDVVNQHHHEVLGRPSDPHGEARSAWLTAVAPAQTAREEHLRVNVPTSPKRG